MEIMDSVTCDQVRGSLFSASEDVLTECDRQLGKWGVRSHHPTYWIGILGEEFGEACKEAIEWGLHGEEEESRRRLYTELSHVAAVAMSAMECLQRTVT